MAANVAVNGSFETGNFSGWTQFGNTDCTGVGAPGKGATAPDGDFFACFGPVGSAGDIGQTVASAGTCNVSFDLANDSGSFSSVDFGGITLLSNVGNSGFTNYNFTVTVAAGSTLSFSFQNDPSYYYLDNVVVDSLAAAVPEPQSWALLIAGFGLIGAMMRRRRNAIAA